jgi:hypothetical protein
MTIIELTNHNQLPDITIGYICVTPEDAIAEHRRNYGKAEIVYRVTRGKKVTLYIPKEAGHETREAEAPPANAGTS